MTDAKPLREIVDEIVAALQPVIGASGISQAELHAAGRYLNRVGVAGVFPAMLDIAFGMTISDRDLPAPGATRQCLEGPEYQAGAPVRTDGDLIDKPVGDGVKRLEIRGRVLEARSGEPVAGATIDVWNADQDGIYDRDGFHLRGVVPVGDDGRYRILTVLPQDYAEHGSDPIGELLASLGRTNYRPAHVHLKVHVDGRECLTTQLYREDSPYLDKDYVVGAVSEDLILKLQPDDTDSDLVHAEFDFKIVPAESSAAR